MPGTNLLCKPEGSMDKDVMLEDAQRVLGKEVLEQFLDREDMEEDEKLKGEWRRYLRSIK